MLAALWTSLQLTQFPSCPADRYFPCLLDRDKYLCEAAPLVTGRLAVETRVARSNCQAPFQLEPKPLLYSVLRVLTSLRRAGPARERSAASGRLFGTRQAAPNRENSPKRIPFSGTVRSAPGSAAVTAGYFHGSLGCWQVTHGSNPPCAAAACYGSRAFPLAGPISGVSSESSGAPTGGDTRRHAREKKNDRIDAGKIADCLRCAGGRNFGNHGAARPPEVKYPKEVG